MHYSTIAMVAALLLSGGYINAQLISDKEKATIVQMREEEKMARDVYLSLNEKWDHQVFTNISGSESYHMSMVKLLMDKFNLPDPVTKNNDKRGVFENHMLQKMYNELTAAGMESSEAAFRAGAKVEEIDINDLVNAIAETSNADIKSTYQYLLQASYNHLRAFVRNLKRMGFIYQPIILSTEDYEKILEDDKGHGRH